MRTILDDYIAVSVDSFSRIIGKPFESLKGMSPQDKLDLVLHIDSQMAETAARKGYLGDRFRIQEDGQLVANAANVSASFILWAREKKFYKIAEDFGSQLFLTDCAFETKHIFALPQMCIIVQFPETVELRLLNGNIVKALTFARITNGISFLFHEYTPEGKYTAQADYYFMSFERPEMKELMERPFSEVAQSDILSLKCGNRGDATEEIIEYAVKSVIYIFSANPDLREYKPLPTGKDLVRRERDRNTTENEKNGKWPMMLVGYDWKKPKTYHVDGTTVSGHFRWQPCGKNREDVKLIWIDEHHRSFNRE